MSRRPLRQVSGPISRRAALAGLTGAALSTGTRPAATQGLPESLGALAAARGILFGAALGPEALADPAYAALYAHEARILTTRAALITEHVRPSPAPDAPANFADADAVLAFADRLRLPLRGHALIWNDNTPPWMKGRSAAELRAAFDRHIDETVRRYAGRLHSWDVVNEPFHIERGDIGGWRQGPWLTAFGPAYVARGFTRAAAIDRRARLVLNEAWTERGDALGATVRRNLLRLVDDLLDKGIALQAVGLQGHLKLHEAWTPALFTDFLAELARRKLDIYITELDVSDLEIDGTQTERDARVAERYGSFLRAVLKEPAVKVVITWDLADKYSYFRAPWFLRQLSARQLRHPGRALPYDDALQRKPAWTAIADALRDR